MNARVLLELGDKLILFVKAGPILEDLPNQLLRLQFLAVLPAVELALGGIQATWVRLSVDVDDLLPFEHWFGETRHILVLV